MLKLVGDDVQSIEQFMSRYRVSTSESVALFLIRSQPVSSPCRRWIFPRPFTVSRSVFQRLLSTQVKQVRRPENGSLRRRRFGLLLRISFLIRLPRLTIFQSFITFMDALKLRMRAKDQLHPILQELATGYARFKGSKDWEGRSKMVGWCVTPSMPISHVLYLSLKVDHA